MTDKEKIINDGVDVSKCRFYCNGACEEITDEDGGYIDKCTEYFDCYFKQLQRKEQECEELRIKLIQKDEASMFFNTPIEGWDNDPCKICQYKNEFEKLKQECDELISEKDFYLQKIETLENKCEELKKEIINKNEKIKELRFSVSDLTNRLCYLNAEKSFRIVDLEQTLDEIEKELKEDIYCENQECGCNDFEECLKCTKEHILDIINKAKDGE